MKIILALIITVILRCTSTAQTTSIPDSNFEQELISLGYDIGPINGSIATSSIDTITSLDISWSSINDLTGIEDFTSLTKLICNHNQLASIDVSQNNSLTWFWCWGNQLTSLDVTQNTNLTNLHCGKNQLTGLNVSQNPELSRLYCFENQLTNLNITQNVLLDTFYCGSNQLSSLDLSQNTNLTLFDCINNPLTSLDPTQNISLIQMYCDSNQITSLDVSQNTSLEILSCYNNQLTYLDVTQNTNLTELNVKYNQVLSLDVSQNIGLSILNCFSNQLTSLDASQNTALTMLNVSNNNLKCLNVKNGVNQNMFCSAKNNSHLNCIEVDDVNYSDSNWTYIDSTASFSSNCTNPCVLGFNENILSSISIFPNPASNVLNVEILGIDNAQVNIYSINGQLVHQEKNSKIKVPINISHLPDGMYLLSVFKNGIRSTSKFTKE